MIMAWYIMVCWKHGWMEGQIDGPDLCEGCDGDGWMDERTDECMQRLLSKSVYNHQSSPCLQCAVCSDASSFLMPPIIRRFPAYPKRNDT